MNKEVAGNFEKIDGWASHSYPNHGFWENRKIRGAPVFAVTNGN